MRKLTLLIVLLVAIPAQARDKEQLAMCTGAASCVTVTPAYWGMNTRVEYSVDDDTGCPGTAVYSIQGSNDAGSVNWHEVASLTSSSGSLSSVTDDPAIWYPNYRTVSSDTTGCTSLEVNLWVTRN